MRAYLILAVLLYSCAEPRFQGETEPSSPQGIQTGKPPVTANSNEPQTSDAAEAIVVTPGSPAISAPVEGTTPPEQINGTYLACAHLLDTSVDESLSKTTVACRLEAADGSRFKPESLNAEATYSVKTSDIPGVTVNIMALVDENRSYDTIIEYFVANHGDSETAADSSTVSLELRDKTSGVALGSWSGLTKSIYQPLNAGYWIRNGNTQHTFVDTVTTLTWGIDDLQVYSMTDAASQCAASNYDNRSGWRLPTVDELKIATGDGLGKVFSGAEDMNVIANSVDFYWSSTLGADGLGYSLNIKQADHRVLQSSPGSLLGVLCVID